MTLSAERLFCGACLCKAVIRKTAAKESVHTICAQRSLMKWYWWGPTQCSGLPALNAVQMRWTGWFAQIGAHRLQTQEDVATLAKLYLLLNRRMQKTILILIKKKKIRKRRKFWHGYLTHGALETLWPCVDMCSRCRSKTLLAHHLKKGRLAAVEGQCCDPDGRD